MKSPVIVALDFDAADRALALTARLDPTLCRVKVGKELFTSSGPALLEQIQAQGFEVFLDLKFHDIPNTVAAAVSAASDLGVWMVNVHASGGSRMMEAARDAVAASSGQPLLVGVTVLTSMSDEDLQELGWREGAQTRVEQLAELVRKSGLDGVVCSAQETALLRAHYGADFKLVTPGIRLAGDAAGDQCRIVTPQQALLKGSDYLVIGRSITQAEEPIESLQRILRELEEN